MTYETLPALTDRDEWLAWRREGLGGSDVAVILGLSPWTSPLALWADKRGAMPELDATDAMEFGKRAEPMIGEWFHDRTGLYLVGEQQRLIRPDKPWMRATVDGFVTDADLSLVPSEWVGPGATVEPIAVGEVKTTSDSADEWAEAIPAHYQAQATWLSAITGLRHVTFPTLHLAYGRVQFVIHELVVSDADANFLEGQAEGWWRRYVLGNVAPTADGHESTDKALAALYAGEPPGLRIRLDHADPDVEDLVMAYAEAKAQEHEAELNSKSLGNRLRQIMGNATVGLIGDDVRVSWKSQDSTRVDVVALREAEPELVQLYTATKSYRVLRTHKPKPPKGSKRGT